MKITVNLQNYELKFPFEKYSLFILSVLPQHDVVGVKEIKFVEQFSRPKGLLEGSLACYLQGQNGHNAVVEVNIHNLINSKIPKYLFDKYYEIASLLLSESIGHEIGHHTHTFRRHGIKKKMEEAFAEKYARATYYHYIKSRRSEIISTYEKASHDSVLFDKEGRKLFIKGMNEIIDWLDENKNGIPFP